MLLLRVAGEFDICGVAPVEAALDRALAPVTRSVVFDLRDVTFLDMSGLVTLIRANERSRGESFDVHVVPPTGLARRVFTLTRAGEKLTILDDVPAQAVV